jgi:hypothetical protein
MTPEQNALIEKRKREFDAFYDELMPCLVDFVGRMGITPAHEVLRHAPMFAPNLSLALKNLVVVDEGDRVWLLTRLGYFIGEYFAQKYSGAWYVNENPSSKYLGRYVVGKFAIPSQRELNIDPFVMAEDYVATLTPRTLALENILLEVEKELSRIA